jgi:hypothetical protein
LRNAAAHFDDDFGYDEPVRKKSPRQPRATAPKARRKKKGKGRFSLDMHKVARYSAIGMSATVALGIMVNALVMQKGHHPAPLFAKKIEIGQADALVPAPAPAAKVVPAPQAAQDAAPIAEPTESIAIPTPPAKPRRVVASTTADKAPGDDPIARLLKSSTGGASADKTDAKTLMGVQRALVKLGYVLKPNGTMGPLTKKAIEGFEKDRHMPVNGEVSHRLVKILAAESGLKID